MLSFLTIFLRREIVEIGLVVGTETVAIGIAETVIGTETTDAAVAAAGAEMMTGTAGGVILKKRNIYAIKI